MTDSITFPSVDRSEIGLQAFTIVFEPILTEVLGEESTKEALAYGGTVGKSTLKANTDKAFEDGAFGLPWMVCTNSKGQTEGFWGVDRIGEVLRFLLLEKPTGDWKSRL
ncbi:2-hydroxychromene-2-carboxylate isomerase [Apiospora rasikravindrae]|uniref:2-hydroxychromene-2-carboxylate isomerase n=1 Tax=Apiospora rasikravindrae TaxID=990691 RepID=A0ABR1SCS3_9PEZI